MIVSLVRAGPAAAMLIAAIPTASAQPALRFDHLRDNPALRDNTIVNIASGNGSENGAGIDFVPSLLDLADVAAPPGVTYDGHSVAATLLGRAKAVWASLLFWRRPPTSRNRRNDLRTHKGAVIRSNLTGTPPRTRHRR